VFRRLHERELELMRAEKLADLLKVIVAGLGAAYRLDAVSLVLADPQHEVRHLLQGDGHQPEEFTGVVFCDSLATLAPGFLLQSGRPWLGPYVTADHQLLLPQATGIGSVAILPLARGDRLLGVLVFGSSDDRRFTRHHASDFQAHLAATTAFCLENACNRARVQRAGLTDYLTGWHNKRYLHNRLREELARGQRAQTPVALLMLDLDHFKDVNDTYGHLSGDLAIREVAARVESQIRQSDAAARFGGDEFAVLLPGLGQAGAAQLAERIRTAVTGQPVELADGNERTLTLSIGVASFTPAMGADLKALADQLLAEADAALYRAKSAGRDRIEIHT
jgi:two-component system, cell cycle response regulator